MHDIKRMGMSVRGVVQGVGFRPFVYNLALSLNLKGLINNTAEGVQLEVEGEEAALAEFARRIQRDAPPLAIIEEVTHFWLDTANYDDFKITESEAGLSKFTLISPDMATCPGCLAELNNPGDRRFGYPFINCTNCGPRFTIIKDVPYDRPLTTMSCFPMCPDCLREYNDPLNRRFHAQPNACPVCGPQVNLLDRQGNQATVSNPLTGAVEMLKKGQILAVKGLGGYHLACDAYNNTAVERLRKLKNREAKPFAVMMPNLEAVREHCLISTVEEQVLVSGKRPIILLRKKNNSRLSGEVAPNNRCLGVMLPYTPLHHLLFVNGPQVLVMTSGNSSGEAIEYLDNEALANLGGIADFFLTHNRDIHIRTDDSVLRIFRGREMMIRRSRGYAPLPVKLPFRADGIMATGAELKNTLCLTRGNMAFLSQYIGDLENLSNILAFEQTVNHLQKMFDINPEAVAYDLHPDYLSSKYAQEMSGLEGFPVQHHHAHIASCMAENGLLEDVIGVALDGAGYGTDGTIWGGEFFTGSCHGFTRRAHLAYVPMPGGAKAIKQPWRMAVSYLETLPGIKTSHMSLPPFKYSDPQTLEAVRGLIKHPSTIVTSGAGRLFDAVSSLLGVRQEISYEGQAAIELEQLASESYDCRSYGFTVIKNQLPWTICLDTMFAEIVDDLLHQHSVQKIASRFHMTISEIIIAVCCLIRQETGINKVVLSGGVFQNTLLLSRSVKGLEMELFEVYTHSLVPCNDGGIALGQAVMAGWALKERGKASCV
ncbi:MAG: carbamoyltransferase HypF [Bacillota bacterium]